MAASPTLLDYQMTIDSAFKKFSKIKRTRLTVAIKTELVFWLFGEGKLDEKQVNDVVSGLFYVCHGKETKEVIAKYFGVSTSSVSEHATFLQRYYDQFRLRNCFVICKKDKNYAFSISCIHKKTYGDLRNEIMNRLKLKGGKLNWMLERDPLVDSVPLATFKPDMGEEYRLFPMDKVSEVASLSLKKTNTGPTDYQQSLLRIWMKDYHLHGSVVDEIWSRSNHQVVFITYILWFEVRVGTFERGSLDVMKIYQGLDVGTAKNVAQQALKTNPKDTPITIVPIILTDRATCDTWELYGDALTVPYGESKLMFTNPITHRKSIIWYTQTPEARLRIKMKRFSEQFMEAQIRKEVEGLWEFISLHTLSVV